jgi:transcriptional regulator with XRE-family HTH domain
MTAKRKGPKKRPAAEPGEGLEWFSPFVARGIMEQKGLTVSRLARLANRNHQTVSNLLSGDQMKRAQPGLLHAIARALDVDVGLIQQPPGQLVEQLLHPARGFEHEYSVRTALEAMRLVNLCEQASKRDVVFWRDWLGGVEELDTAVPVYVRAAFSRLLTIGYHRERWLVPFYPDARAHMLSPRGDRSNDVVDQSARWHPLRGRPVVDEQHEAGLVSLIQSYEHVLRPWLEAIDGMGFNYAELRRQTVRDEQHDTLGLVRSGAPRIGDQWMPSFASVPAPTNRANEDRDPYRVLGLARAQS